MRGTGAHTPPDDMQDSPENTTWPFVTNQVIRYSGNPAGPVIHTEIAREIAANYGGTPSSLLVFAETGQIRWDLADDIRHDLLALGSEGQLPSDRRAAMDLGALLDYVERAEAWECEGHESLDGADMGRATYCDGSCVSS